MSNKPLTAADLADALGCFSNAAISAMHNGTHTVGCIAQGIDAVMWRLQEIADIAPPSVASIQTIIQGGYSAPPGGKKPAPPKTGSGVIPPAPQLSGEACTNCGNFALVRSGTCMTCQMCGTTNGCS